MDKNTVPGRHARPEPDIDPLDAPTVRMPAVVGAEFDRYFPAASTGRHAAKEDAVPELDAVQAQEIVDRAAEATPVPEADTDAGWARLAGLLDIRQAVA